ncbi:hypothetical protein QR680_008887 [Steinernema hermaphroditum]|uniref:Uncharacterized protein n=1 Tax=Steinernema hermaphroditum TaxID=289476 RepID=A0AA39M8X3_9BILA|nr:hypothetical protein QR680_008887 [Steinernema hermaphroditum]
MASVEYGFHFVCVVTSCSSLGIYLKQRKNKNVVPSLVLYIIISTLFGVAGLLDSTMHILQEHRLVAPEADSSNWVFLLKTLSMDFVYVSGATLALDRVLIMSIHMKYTSWKLGKRLSEAALFFCFATSFFVVTSKILLPFEVQITGLSTTLMLQYLGNVYDIVVALEILLHVLFCVRYYRFVGNQQHSYNLTRISKANHITLFQAVSETTFCLVPKLLYKANVLFFDADVLWINVVSIHFTYYFAFHIALTSVFIIYKLTTQRVTYVVRRAS